MLQLKKQISDFLNKIGISRKQRNVVIPFFSRNQRFLVLWSGRIVRGFQFPFFRTLWRSIPRVPGVPCTLWSYISKSRTRGLIFLEMNSPMEQFSTLASYSIYSECILYIEISQYFWKGSNMHEDPKNWNDYL